VAERGTSTSGATSFAGDGVGGCDCISV